MMEYSCLCEVTDTNYFRLLSLAIKQKSTSLRF